MSVDIDWTTIYQDHHDKRDIPKFNSGLVLSLNGLDKFSDEYSDLFEDGVIDDDHYHQIEDNLIKIHHNLKQDWLTYKRVIHRGSHSTSLLIYSDGKRVYMSGNIGRYNRPDNLYNLNFHQTIKKANRILLSLGLPAFTFGKTSYYHDQVNFKRHRAREYGAVITRLDINRNYCTGSESNAYATISALSRKAMPHVMRSGLMGKSTVYWGKRGGRLYTKAYIKHEEMIAHSKGQIEKAKTLESRVYNFCKNNGIVRLEITLDSKTLHSTGLLDIEKIDMAKLIKIYENRVNPLFDPPKFKIENLDLTNFPKPLAQTVSLWKSGVEFGNPIKSPATWYRHRTQLLEYGIDIAVRFLSDENKDFYFIKTVTMSEMPRPDWYITDEVKEFPPLRVVNG